MVVVVGSGGDDIDYNDNDGGGGGGGGYIDEEGGGVGMNWTQTKSDHTVSYSVVVVVVCNWLIFHVGNATTKGILLCASRSENKIKYICKLHSGNIQGPV